MRRRTRAKREADRASASCRSIWKRGRTSYLDEAGTGTGARPTGAVSALYTSTVRGDDKPGDLLQVAPDQLLQLPPLHTVLRGGKRSGTKQRAGHLGGAFHGHRHAGSSSVSPRTATIAGGSNSTSAIWSRSRRAPERRRGRPNEAVYRRLARNQVQEAAALAIRRTYPPRRVRTSWQPAGVDQGTGDRPGRAAPSNGRPGLCRRLWEFLAEVAEDRRRSPAASDALVQPRRLVSPARLRRSARQVPHRTTCGSCCTPRHEPSRPERHHGGGRGVPEGGADIWILWRRVAGGLNGNLAAGPLRRLALSCCRPRARRGQAEPQRAGGDVAGGREPGTSRRQAQTSPGRGPAQASAAQPGADLRLLVVDALGARMLLYGPLNAVLHPRVAETWLDALLSFEPGNRANASAGPSA